MKKRILTWMVTLVVAFTMVLGGSTVAFAASDTGDLYWSWKVPTTANDWGSYGISSPVVRGNSLFVASYDKLYKIQYFSGKDEGSVKLGGNVQYNRIAPTVGDGKIFVPLTDSKLTVVDATTMKVLKTITYAEGETAYQSISPAVYDSANKDLYLGSWGGTKAGTFVKIDVDNDYKVTEIVDGKGFYYAGAAVAGDYVVFGSDAPNDELDGTATLYAWKKNETDPDKALISTEVTGVGSIRSTVVENDGTYYFTTKGGKFYKAVIAADGSSITATKVADLGASSVCTPLLSEGKAYVGYQLTSGWDSKGGVKVIDLATETVVATYENVPANVVSLFKSASGVTKDKVLATYNGYPGGIWNIEAGANHFTPDADMQQYCMASITAITNTMFYTNDSNHLMAIRDTEAGATTHALKATAGAGGTVSPSLSSVKDGKTANLYIKPDDGFKIASVKVDGTAQDVSYDQKGSVTFKTGKLTKDTAVEVTFEKIGEAVTEKIEVSVQSKDVFHVAHAKLDVSSDLAEKYGYDDKVLEDTVSALDALVAAHIKVYGNDEATIKANLSVSGGSPSKMMGVSGISGFAVNEGYAKDASNNGYLVNTAPLKDGDRVDFFWYEDSYWMDTVTAFTDGTDKVFTKTVEENEVIDITVEGFAFMMGYQSDELDPIAGASIAELEQQADGSYKVAAAVKDADGKDVKTDKEGHASLTLAPGKHYLTALKGDYSSKLVMPWLEVTVLCDKHDYKDGKCRICGMTQEQIDQAEKDASATNTGDDSNMLLFGLVSLTAMAAAAATVFYRRKTN